jgi:hypothetical protein
MSVSARAGDAKATAAVTAVSCKNLKTDFTSKPIYPPRSERNPEDK